MVEAVTVPTTVVSDCEWSVDDLEHMPGRYRYEILDGVLYMSPLPKLPHGTIIANLIDILSPWVRKRNLGRVLPPQTGVYLNDRNYLDPDLIFLRSEQLRARQPHATSAALAVEVLSPSNLRGSREERERLFAQAQVEELWYVDAASRTIEVRRQADGGYTTTRLFTGADVVTSEALPGLEFPLADAWQDLDA